MTGASSTKAKARELKTINPATEEVINTYEIMTKEQINEKAKKAQNGFSDWKKDIQNRVDQIHYPCTFFYFRSGFFYCLSHFFCDCPCKLFLVLS
jgi:hypothetical protein